MNGEMNAVNENAQVEQNAVAQQEQQPAFDYEKVASIVDGKIKATEDSVLKGYFKQQGLTGDEMKEAIEMFKADKASKAPDVDGLNATIKEQEDAIIEAQSRALYAETQMEAMTMASELGVDSKTMGYILRMADISDVITDGQVDHDKLRESLAEVIKDVPQLRTEREDKAAGFKIGADTSEQKQSTNDELAKIFGVKK